MINKYLDISPTVQEAILNNLPVVALESTIISHGMPYPKNLETANQVEKMVHLNGAIPATVAIIDGRIKIGLSEKELLFMAQNPNIHKVSRRDMPVIMAKKLNGATTVATTMIAANWAGISVFVTGGIGGVHRNAQDTFDISADLKELERTNVAVVCAGAKSILDIGLTLEYLETSGVPILGYKTESFPAFFTRESGFKLNHKVDNVADIAKIMKTKWDCGIDGGIVIANPIPAKYAMDNNIINTAINEALSECKEFKITGKDITPFLLKSVNEATRGKSLESNIELVYNNAKIGAQIAKSYSQL